MQEYIPPKAAKDEDEAEDKGREESSSVSRTRGKKGKATMKDVQSHSEEDNPKQSGGEKPAAKKTPSKWRPNYQRAAPPRKG